MSRKRSPDRRANRANRGFYLLSIFVIASMVLSAIFSLLPTPEVAPTPTLTAPVVPTATVTVEPTPTLGAEATPTIGPALAPTP